MDICIEKIYDMFYSPIITPYNLLENAKLDNYSYVKYYKNDDGLIVEMRCEINGEGEKLFFYYFDKKDYLQKIYIENDKDRELVFDRKDAINEAIDEYYYSKPNLSNVI